MSVRRLADESVQPHDFAFSPANNAWFEGELKKYPEGRQRSAIIPALMRAQEQEGWVTKRAIEHIAERLDMPFIRALEVATFYTQFMLSPVGTRAHVQVCGTTPCMLRGSEDLFAVCKSRIGPRPFAPNADGTLSWEEVECQGACVNAPMVMIGKDTFEDLTPERLEEIIDAFDAGRGGEIAPGPQVDRHLSAPVGGRTTLLDYDEVMEHADDRAPLNGRDQTEHVQVPPSEAARPDTHAQATDPAYADPAPNAPNVDPAAEDAASADPDPRESGIGASAESSAEQGDMSATGFGDTPDDLHPDLAQHAPADPTRAGEANRAVAEAQAARDPRGAAVGGVQKEYATETVQRTDPDKHVEDHDTGVEDAIRDRAAPAASMVGTGADVEELQAQRNARTVIGADGVAAGEGAANDPKALYGKQIPGEGTVDDTAKGAGSGKGSDGGKGDPSIAGVGPGPDGAGVGDGAGAGASGTGEGGPGGQARPVDDGAVTTPGGVAAAPPRDPRGAPDQSGAARSGGTADDVAGGVGGRPTGDAAGGAELPPGAAGMPDAVQRAATAPGGADTLAGDPEAPAPATAHEEGPESEPTRLETAREGGPDDLKMIWGVGPKLERMLNEMGFFHFDQIGEWGDAELNWVDRRLTGFRGRARRDQWVDQAARLATGWRPEQGHGESPHS